MVLWINNTEETSRHNCNLTFINYHFKKKLISGVPDQNLRNVEYCRLQALVKMWRSQTQKVERQLSCKVIPAGGPNVRNASKLSSRSRKIVIVIVNSWFLERPQKRSCRNQLIHRRLTKTKSIGSCQDPESQAGRQLDGYGGWCLELRRGGRYGDDDESG